MSSQETRRDRDHQREFQIAASMPPESWYHPEQLGRDYVIRRAEAAISEGVIDDDSEY